jgi:hypothetical protein
MKWIIKDLQTGEESKPVGIDWFLFGDEDLEFPNDSTLPLSDFKEFYRDFEVIPYQSESSSPSHNDIVQKFHVVEFAGYFVIKTEPFYDAGQDILNAEDVGYDKAKENAELIVNLLNKHYGRD